MVPKIPNDHRCGRARAIDIARDDPHLDIAETGSDNLDMPGHEAYRYVNTQYSDC